VGWRRPTPTWRPGEVISDRYGVWLPPDLPPGRYALVLGFYDPDGRRLPAFLRGQRIGEEWQITILEVGP